MNHKVTCFILCLLWVGIFLPACNKPTSIPDEELTAIVSEIFLANAYQGQGLIDYQLLQDSVDMYTPIFTRYGFRPRDFSFTIENLSRRKSVRFSDILDAAILRLETEGGVYFSRLAMDDSIQKLADMRYRTLLLSDTLRHVKRMSNEKSPEVKVSIPGAGRLEVSFVADLDTADRNYYLQYSAYTTRKSDVKHNAARRTYTRGQRKREKFDIMLSDTTMRELSLLFAAPGNDKKKEAKVVLTIDSLRIYYYLLPATALDKLTATVLYPPSEDLPARVAIPDHESYFAKNCGPLRLDTTGVVAPSDSLVRREWITR